ncbi:polysaccharide biosynthesis protein [Virgibacillus sp. NKC19-16]|uniref:PssD/Cps14F family polysaccharide biosynthesis glycosyltransferase n=1 Tax=Virgibacillus salidurans TaxID=2831673 RepID=UPI001F2F73AC|nr:PssD/Cps14F family polysaccharide biosynthesis glycosyltransferase [Virgibacillus sp. NKC19-16]UJL45814.1 polysaccharide biosynthesis protein [Virgibacillus sp. NKC19-16]
MTKKRKTPKICLISSSGGHFEQLKMLDVLSENYDVFWVTENADYGVSADYLMRQTRPSRIANLIIMIFNFMLAIKIWMKERPDYVITTGTLVALPMAILAKVFKKKLVFIETFARIYDGTRAGKLMYKHADLFIVQWESLKEIYPEAVFGGSIY